MPDLAVQKRDGYAEIVAAFIRARFAAAQVKDAATSLREALTAVTDGVAATGGDLEYWDDVLATAYGDLRMPNPSMLAVGRQASAFLELFEEDGRPPDEAELGQLEELIREAIEDAGPGSQLREKLEALWNGETLAEGGA